MKKILLSLIFVLSFSFAVWADIPPRNTKPPIPGQSKQEEKGTCAGAMLFTAGIFLLGHWLIRRNQLVSQSQIDEIN